MTALSGVNYHVNIEPMAQAVSYLLRLMRDMDDDPEEYLSYQSFCKLIMNYAEEMECFDEVIDRIIDLSQ